MIVRLSRLAHAEVAEIHAWYDARQLGLGQEFRQELDRVMGLIGEHPTMFSVAFDSMRRVMLRRFPYFVLYEVFPDAVVVLGVIHGARDSQFWMTRGDA